MLQESREKARRVWVLVLASLASFMVALDALVVTTALTTIRRDLGVSIEELEWTVNAYTLSFASLIGTVFFMAQFLQVAQGYGPLGVGLRLLPWTATLFVVAPLAGALVNRVGERLLIASGLLLQAIGMAWIGLIAAPGLPYSEIVAPLIVAGCGVSLALPATQNAVISSVKAGDIGKASGTFSMFRQLGGAFGVAILAAVFAGAGSFGSARAFSSGFASAIGVAATLSLLGSLAGLVLPGRQAKVAETRKHEAYGGLEHSASQ